MGMSMQLNDYGEHFVLNEQFLKRFSSEKHRIYQILLIIWECNCPRMHNNQHDEQYQ